MEMKNRGYGGGILHLRLSSLDYEVIPTERYARWGGGNGLGTALFWDYCEDKTIRDGRDPKNVVVIATSPLCGTMAPSAGGRCEIVGVSCGQYPVSWFSRSNIGGRLSSNMKYAGWDAIVVSGKAPHPVWVEIENNHIRYHDAGRLWGKDARETQLTLFGMLDRNSEGWGWQPLPGKKDEMTYTTQRPAIVCITPSGENQSIHATLVHDAGNVSGQGGYGAVLGSKNLKAISVIGTGSVKAADPAALVRARFRVKERYAPDVHNPDLQHWGFLGNPLAINFSGGVFHSTRRKACAGCIMGCRLNFDTGYGNESKCQATAWYAHFALQYTKGDQQKAAEIAMRAGDYCNVMGINTYSFSTSLLWMEKMWHKGLLGPGKKIHSELDFSQLGSWEFAKAFVDAFAYRRDIGKLFGEGIVQGAIKAGFEKEWREGELDHPYWGIPAHGYDPRAEVEWGYATILTDRDINSHEFNALYWGLTFNVLQGVPPLVDPEEAASIIAKKLQPYVSGPECMDYSDKNIYSDAVMNLTRWYIHNNRFWKNSALFCDLRWGDLIDTNAPDNIGATGDPEVGEQVYWNAVTGDGIGFVDGLKKGHRTFVLQNAIWALQGRHRDMVHFADYIYEKDLEHTHFPFFMWSTRDENGIWRYEDVMHRRLDREKFEDFKTRFYRAEGLDPETGWPTAKTLRELGLEFAVSELKRHKKLGREA